MRISGGSDLQIRGGGLKKNFAALRASFWCKAPPLDPHNDWFCKTTRLRNQQKLASGTLHQCMHCQHVTLNIKQKMAADKYFEGIRAESLCFFCDKWRQPRCCRVLQYPRLISFLYDSRTTFEERFNRRRWPLHRRVRQSRVREICSPYSMRTTNILWKKPRLWFTRIFIRLVIQDFWTPWWSSI